MAAADCPDLMPPDFRSKARWWCGFRILGPNGLRRNWDTCLGGAAEWFAPTCGSSVVSQSETEVPVGTDVGRDRNSLAEGRFSLWTPAWRESQRQIGVECSKLDITVSKTPASTLSAKTTRNEVEQTAVRPDSATLPCRHPMDSRRLSERRGRSVRPRHLGLFCCLPADCRWMGVFARAVDTYLWAVGHDHSKGGEATNK